jgi:hypothetical protein
MISLGGDTACYRILFNIFRGWMDLQRRRFITLPGESGPATGFMEQYLNRVSKLRGILGQ